MSNWTVDTENKGKNYLNEKELFIIYWILKNKHISTGWSNVFTLDSKYTFIPKPTSFSEIATIEEDINNNIEQSIKRIHDRMGSPTVLRYLLDTGKLFDEKGFSVYGDADYSLVEGGFLCDYMGATMHEYLEDTEENRKNTEIYWNLNDEQKAFLDEAISGKDFDSAEFSKLAHPPVKEYREAILNKEADDDFIELVNKLVKEYDGGKWNTEDIERFFEIYYRHNKEEFKKNALTKKTFLYEDSQKQLSGLIFEHTNFGLFIKNTDKLQKYFDTYLKTFMNDELNGLSSKGLTGTFFKEGLSIPLHTQFFGFKKQKSILIKHIEDKYEEYQRNDLEIGHPFFEPEYIGNDTNDTVKITINNDKDKIKDLFLFVHSMLSLEKEGYLKIEDFSYGPKQMFDLYDRGYLFKIKLNKKTETSTETENIPQKNTSIKPFLITEKRKGYLKFTKNGEKIFIGNTDTRKFRLLKVLMEPIDTLGTARNIDIVFEAIKLLKDKDNVILKDNYLKKNKQISIIEYTIKELQKIRKLQGRLHFVFDNGKRIMWLEVS
jgi:hypothetical protein